MVIRLAFAENIRPVSYCSQQRDKSSGQLVALTMAVDIDPASPER
jgi:hypothetical protein